MDEASVGTSYADGKGGSADLLLDVAFRMLPPAKAAAYQKGPAQAVPSLLVTKALTAERHNSASHTRT